MGNKADGQKTKRKEWAITKYGRIMLQKMLRSPTAGRSEKTTSVSPARAVCCEELFLPAKGKKGHRFPGDCCRLDPFVAAQIAAQNHFSLRPNLNL
ncbi:hypothetical protein V6N13_008040 [Hibiscus sabdariffa]|uniref:Uncharacterized protein n=1 Tax=Hibiscus sabdariffa TaxID=183260 RepID=A0ABR2ECH3_9ROSI